MNGLSTSRFPQGAIALIAVSFLIAVASGCSAPRDTVPVVERPASTEEGPDVQARMPSQLLTEMPAGYDTVQVRPFDLGKMWAIDAVPQSYLNDEYGVDASDDWLSHMQRASLRFSDTCSGGFVSNTGLLVTNHHCAREHITAVSEEGEALGESGFVAGSLSEERETPDLFVDQLVEVEEVTDRIYRGARTLRSFVRRERVDSLERELNERAQERDETLRVSVEALYQGARYKAYTYRRYTDVRLVMAPEQQVGFFGGDTDNFTYPRYNLDVAFYRVYDEDEPITPERYFEWSHTAGSEADMAVFAAGTPGSTSRLTTVSQMKYQRDFSIPDQLRFLEPRIEAMEAFFEENSPADWPQLGNTLVSLKNSQKSLQGQLEGLDDPYFIARRTANERALQDSIRSVDSLRQHYSGLTRDMDQLQEARSSLNRRARAFNGFANTRVGSRIITRAMYGYYMDQLGGRRGTSNEIVEARREADQIEDWPAEVEQAAITQRLQEIRESYGSSDPTMQRIFEERTPLQWAEMLVEESRLSTQEGASRLFDRGYRDSNDPSVQLVEALAPLYFSVVEQIQDFNASEQSINARLNEARLIIFGSDRIAPDANATLRVSDGRVRGYQVDTTAIEPYTTFGGMYDRAADRQGGAWQLPERWMVHEADSTLRNTALNLVSTVDISGGSSGSPLVNDRLELVGVVFDSNYEALPNRFLYRDEQARAIAVDSRGIIEALRRVYNADSLVDELVNGRMQDVAAER
ncbi:MAG: S46 family peptidase [Longimonas sp.]|uniref:S46 family peptidase n=1 Tax=Longimonas sp. TaxID=2039626 RepID=UPI003347AA59